MAGSGVAPPDEQSERSVIYLRVPLQELPDLRSLQLPREDFQYHSAPPLAANEDRLPTGSYVLINLSPNPFNSAATATIRLERRQDVSLILTDTQGREAATLFRGRMGAGETNLSFSAGDLPSGVYILQLKGATGVSAIKTAIVR